MTFELEFLLAEPRRQHAYMAAGTHRRTAWNLDVGTGGVRILPHDRADTPFLLCHAFLLHIFAISAAAFTRAVHQLTLLRARAGGPATYAGPSATLPGHKEIS